MVGAPTGALDVASFMVGMPAVGVYRGLVAAPIGVSGLVPARTVDASGIVGAPVANGALAGAPAVGVRGAVAVRGGLTVPPAVIGLISIPVGAVPLGAEVLRGIVGAGGAGGRVTGGVLAVATSGGVLVS